MKSIHPFPARMAPDILEELLETVPTAGVVLDPMCGSGTVVRKAAYSGKKARGSDTDPLALLMTSVATKKVDPRTIDDRLDWLTAYVQKHQSRLQSILGCAETEQFASFWFGPEQHRQLNAIARGILKLEQNSTPKRIIDLFRLALSRTIITKSKGATLAADVSHSRPHRVRCSNDYDVLENFTGFVTSIVREVNLHHIKYPAKVSIDDARLLKTVGSSSVDVIITSPPYLNALDYLRGHRLSLIWLGKTIPDLRTLRGNNVGSERSLPRDALPVVPEAEILRDFSALSSLSPRHLAMTVRFASDLALMCKQFARVLKSKSQLHVVIGNSTLGDVYIPNSEIFAHSARKFGFKLKTEKEREIPESKRYLPIGKGTRNLQKRMRTEVIQSYELAKD